MFRVIICVINGKNTFGRLPMLEKERAYYESNLNSLRETYMGRYVLISGDRLSGGYDSDEEALPRPWRKIVRPAPL